MAFDPNFSTLAITQNSAVDVSIGNNVSGSYLLLLSGDGPGKVSLNGTSGQYLFRKTGTSAFELNGASQFYSMTVEGGTIRNSGQQSLSRPSTIASTSAVAAHMSCWPARSPQIMA